MDLLARGFRYLPGRKFSIYRAGYLTKKIQLSYNSIQGLEAVRSFLSSFLAYGAPYHSIPLLYVTNL